MLANFRWHVVEAQSVRVTQQNHILDHVTEFANIAWPIVKGEDLEDLFAKLR
jgi:hypothetical protein